MRKISGLITGRYDSRHPPSERISLEDFFPPSIQASHLATSPRSAEGNDTAAPQDLREIHFCFLPVYRIHWLPPRGCFCSLVVYEAGAHQLGVTGSKSPAACLLWQVLIENQTQVASSLNFKAFLWPSVNRQAGITLDTDAQTQETCESMYYRAKKTRPVVTEYVLICVCIHEMPFNT